MERDGIEVMKVRILKTLLGITGVLGACFVSDNAMAQKTSAMLPEGVWRVRYVGVRTGEITQAVNAEGFAQPLMAQLEQSIDMNTLAQQSPELQQLRGALNSYERGLGDSFLMANLFPSAELVGTQNILAAEYGLTPKISLGIIVPIVSFNMRANFQAGVQDNLQAVQEKVKGYGALEGALQKYAQGRPDTSTFANSIFTQNGYQTPGNFGWTGLGDVELGAKFELYKNPNVFTSSLLGGFRLPTATHEADLTNILDKNSGDKQWDLAFEWSNDYSPASFLTFGATTRYTFQLANSQQAALYRVNSTSALPNLNDPDTIQNVRRDLGDMLESELSVTGNYDRFLMSFMYQNKLKGEDDYTVPAGFRSDNLEEDTEQVEHRGAVGLRYSTLKAYVAKQAALPFEAMITYNRLLAGRNVPNADFARLDLIFFLK